MTVRELIEALSQQDPDATVVLNMGKNELANGKEVAGVHVARGVRDKWQGYWSDVFFRDPDLSDEECGYDRNAVVVNLTTSKIP